MKTEEEARRHAVAENNGFKITHYSRYAEYCERKNGTLLWAFITGALFAVLYFLIWVGVTS